MSVNKYALVPAAAKLCGVPRSTLNSAVITGKIKTYPLADGALTVRLADVKKWDTDRKRGV